MIHSISANNSHFHMVKFKEGLNVILADRSEGSSNKDTRNGVGKSTLIEIINFCLGSNVIKGLTKPLKGWAFTLELTLGGSRVKVMRAIDNPQDIVVNGATSISVDEWKQILGNKFFHVRPQENNKYKPSYRSLVSYFIRSGGDAYLEPFSHTQRQSPWNSQLHIAYLLGMNWEYAANWQELKDQRKDIVSLNKLIKAGRLSEFMGNTIGELETQRIQLEQKTNAIKLSLDNFKVHEQYQQIEKDAGILTEEIHNLSNNNIKNLRRLNLYKKSIEGESPPKAMAIERVYSEAGYEFPSTVKKTLEEVRCFHDQIIVNRKNFLKNSIEELEKTIKETEQEIESLTNKRAEVMEILNTHGALQEMNKLQDRYVDKLGGLRKVESQIKNMKDLKLKKEVIEESKISLYKSATQDHEERREIWTQAVRLFNSHSHELYETPGEFVIDINNNGYEYKVDISRSGSEGVDKMKIFCFDLALLELQETLDCNMGFLIHDSLMYDSVDSRQRALALECAHRVTSQLNKQYICMFNSDMVPEGEFNADFHFDDYVRLRLDDKSPEGRLLGIEFERSGK